MGERVETGSGASAGAKRVRRVGAAYMVTLLALLACALGRPDTASAQWTTPDASNNINNTNSGNVGVGTGASAPAGRLDVKGATSDSTASALNVRNSSDANLLFVRNDGRIGIGTASPSVLLHMNTGATRAEFNMQTSHTSGPIIRFRQDAGAAESRALGALNFLNETGGTPSQIYVGYAGTDNTKSFFKFTTSGTEALRISSDGSVGIGTITPGYKLDVAGQVRSSAGGFVFPDGTTQVTASAGTVTGVNAGAGLSGGGSGGTPTLSVNAGTGLTAGAGGVSVNYGSAAGTAVQGNTSLTVTAGSGLSGGGQLALGAGGTLTLTNDDKGSAQNIFKNVANAAGAVQFSAGSNGDAISFEGTGGTSVSFNAAAKKVVINSSASAASGWTDAGASLSTTNTSASVGVGVASPQARLHVVGGARLEGAGRVYLGTTAPAGARGLEIMEENATTFSLRHHDPNVAWQNIAINPYAGRVGVNTVNPLGPLSVGDAAVDGSDGFLVIGKRNGAGTRQFRVGFDANFNFVIGDYGGGNFAGAWSAPFAVNWQAPSNSLYINSGGSVGLGTGAPAARLDVNAGSDTAAAIKATGSINATGAITGATMSATYQDVAEWVPSTQKLAAGTVVVLDTNRSNHVLASAGAYDTKVAGVVSAQPGVILGVGGEDKLKVATTGRVKVKVDASRGAIKVGDLLVTSGVEGVAMRSVPVDLGGIPIHRPGTIIGKALEPLEKGVGEILVLLSLQ